jgi:ATP-binding cassette subfamily B protein
MDSMKNNSKASDIFFEFIKDYPLHFGALLILLLLEGAVAAISIITLVPLADFMLDPMLTKPSQITFFVTNYLSFFQINPSFLIFGVLFILANLIKGLLEVATRYVILRIKYAILEGLLRDTLKTFFKSRWGFFSELEQGSLFNTMNRELNAVGDTVGHLATFLAQSIQLIIYLAVPMWLNWQLTLTALLLIALFGSLFMLLNKHSYRLGQINTQTANVAVSILGEILGAAHLILGYSRQKQARIRYLNAFSRHSKASLHSQLLSGAVPKLFQPMCLIGIIVALSFALKDNTPISELATVMWSLLGSMPIFNSLMQNNISISNFLPSYDQLLQFRKRAKKYEEVEGYLKFEHLSLGIELNNVNFSYPDRNKTLNNLNLFIKKGEITALIGGSGSGKSTVTDVILGLLLPEHGRVLLDGVPYSKWILSSFRERVGYVPQDSQLFHLSIRDNLLWSNESATVEQMWAALDFANASGFVKELPQGLDTMVGDQGQLLSGGQRQRIALARALIRNPELLILDEATSALDLESERLIQDAIECMSGEITILIIAHRLSTIAKADVIYVLDKGSAVESGTFSELTSMQDSFLNKMLKSQINKF